MALLLAATLACVPIASAAELPVAFSLVSPSQLNVDASVPGLFSDDASTTLSGSIDGVLQLSVEPTGADVTGIRFTDGDLAASDFVLSETLFLGSGVDISGSNIGGDIVTPTDQFSPVTQTAAGSGAFATEDHELSLNRGTLVGTGTGLASAINFAFDLDSNPLSELTLSGQANVAWELLSSSGLDQTYRVTLSLPVDVTDSLDLPGSSLAVSLVASGSVTAEEVLTVTLPLAGDFNGDGAVNAADYTVWRDDFAGGLRPLSDYSAWKASFGAASGDQSVVGAIPEPTTWAALVISAGWGSVYRRPRKRSASGAS